MGASQLGGGKPVKFYNLKAKVDETNTPHFAIAEKVNDKWQVTGKFDTMAGMLNSAEIKEKEFQGAKQNVFILKFEDDNEISQVEMTHNQITHNIINSLSSGCNKIEIFNIKVYRKQSEDKKYWNGGVIIWIGNDKENKVKWSIDPKTAPKRDAVMVNGTQFMQSGKPVWDDSKVRAFWEQMFKDKIIAALGTPIIQPEPSASTTITASNPPDNDDLPF